MQQQQPKSPSSNNIAKTTHESNTTSIAIKFNPIKTGKLKTKYQIATLLPMMNINNFPIKKDIPHKKKSKENRNSSNHNPQPLKKPNKLKINTTNNKPLKKIT